ncbi:cell surface protein (plasmid) [Lactobacillus curvatus]|nr:cell surface protein [Latilactobacillus curvatus]MSD84818.1 cell surface protein [Latilactobacillus curvatus]MSE22868.1 cell surface protein [Latilactobacillus curvatus]MSE24962.1 cell surface protein [Latilactobacillus curvatus]
MKTKLFSALALATVVAPTAMTMGSVSADAVAPKASTADFSVVAKDPTNPTDPDNGTLVLKSVPNFNFGTIEASEIYAGVSGKKATADSTLEISDTRLGVSDWTLTADMGQFTDDTNKLSGATLNLASSGSLGDSLTGAIKDDSSAVEVVKGNGKHGVDNFKMEAAKSTLTLAANPTATLTKDEKFTTTINWNLTSTQPAAPTA